MKKWIPLVVALIFAGWFLGGFSEPKSKDGFNYAAFGRLPVLLEGRIQPFDGVARNSLLSMSGLSEVKLTNGESIAATKWLLLSMTRPEEADKLPIFRITHPDLEGLLGTEKMGLGYYSFNDLTNQFPSISEQARKLAEREKDDPDAAKSRTPFEKDLMHVYGSVQTYMRIKSTLEPEGTADFSREVAVYQQSIAPGRAALDATQQGKTANQEDMERIAAFFKRYDQFAEFAYAMVIPPLASEPRTDWRNMGTSLKETLRSGEVSAAVTDYAAIADAYHTNNPAQFNQAVANYRAWMQGNGLHAELKQSGDEALFDQVAPFLKSMAIYLAAMVAGCLFWINLSQPVRQTGFALLVLAFIIHSVSLVVRMYLTGHPPVINLYSSAIFIGWAACLFGLFLERIFKDGIGLVVAGFIGFATLIIAHHLAMGGDTMEPLQAVLLSNGWLATHVVVVTLGYASMFVAGLAAIIYVVRGFFTTSLSAEMGKRLARIVYGVVCFATLFSFVGTILGGIWADQSWGRFWGWDPKENGALLIVLWNAVILHARWGGMIRERGIVAMAIVGNIITSFSWFGVNMLGIGLHSYGFMDKAFPWLVGFDISQAMLLVVTLLPLHYWASFNKSAAPKPPSGPSLPTPSAIAS